MATTRWRLCVILHLQQYSHRIELFFLTISELKLWQAIKVSTVRVGLFDDVRSDVDGPR